MVSLCRAIKNGMIFVVQKHQTFVPSKCVCLCLSPLLVSNDMLFPVTEQISALELMWPLSWVYEVGRVSARPLAVSDLLLCAA